MTSITLEHKQCLVAGDGNLPVSMAKSAQENGFEVVCISLSGDNYKELKNTHLQGLGITNPASPKQEATDLLKKINNGIKNLFFSCFNKSDYCKNGTYK